MTCHFPTFLSSKQKGIDYRENGTGDLLDPIGPIHSIRILITEFPEFVLVFILDRWS